jgi:aldose 1-epimerase
LFTVQHILNKENSSNYLELKNSDNSSYAKIDLTLGGSLQDLILQNKTIISSKNTLPYEKSFASSILFPFTNRIENGEFIYNSKKHQLNKRLDGYNAIHGLVYDKTFQFINQTSKDDVVSVSVGYHELSQTSGFPFKYAIILNYSLSKEALQLQVEVKNTDSISFPFTLGWHPYFASSDLNQTFLMMNSQKKLVVNERMIPIDEVQIDWNSPLQIESKLFDDCFILNSNKVTLKTPDYHLDFNFSPEENYFQVYTPDNRKAIALEPQTAPANSFNSKRGLKILEPNENYDLTWEIKLKNN